MLTYSGSLALYQKLTNNTETGNTNFFQTFWNEHIRNVLSRRAWYFLDKSESITYVDAQQYYTLAFDVKKVNNLTVVNGTTRYVPLEAPDRVFWDRLNSTTSNSSVTPEYYFIEKSRVGIYPIPSGTSSIITVNYRPRVKDLTLADYTTGTITTIANGSTTVTGTDTTWTSQMAGRYIRITDSDTANTGDGKWYKVASVTSATVLELSNSYAGTSIAVGTAVYAIGQVSLIPEDYQIIPVYMAAVDYWQKEEDVNRANLYEQKAETKIIQMEAEFGSRSDDPVISNGNPSFPNPNLFVTK